MTTDAEDNKSNNKKFIKKMQKIIKTLKISFDSFKSCIGRNGIIILMSITWCFIKLVLFYIIFGVIFVFLSVGIIWGNCSNAAIQESPQIIWKWFIAPKYVYHFNHDWSFIDLFNINRWSQSIEIIFLNYVTVCFVPYFIIIGITILFKIFDKLYQYLVVLTIGFDKICGSEFTLFFIVFVFYRWIYLCFMWYTLLFSKDSDSDNQYIANDIDIISCRITLIFVFIVIVFRSMFD